MRISQVPQLLDGLFELGKQGIRPPTPLIIAMDGAGKNGCLESYAADRGLQLVVTKLSQCESAGDLLGFMATEDQLPCPACCQADPACGERYREEEWVQHGVDEHHLDEAAMRTALEPWRGRIRKATRFLPPGWLPTSGRGILVLDEYNRANSMLENAALEIIREHKLSLSGWSLPPGWIVVALANPNTDKFTGTNPLDAASESRVVILSLEPTVDDFLTYARSKKMHPSVIRFVERQPQCLDGMKFDNPAFQSIEVKPRRLEMLSDLAHVLPETLLLECAGGLLGSNFVDAYAQILGEREAPLLAEEILVGYGKSRARVQALVAANRMDIIDGTLNNVLAHLKDLGEAPGKRPLGNLSKFLCDLPAESVMKFLQAAVQQSHKGGVGKTFAALRDGSPAFGARMVEIMDKGIDLATPLPAAPAAAVAG